MNELEEIRAFVLRQHIDDSIVVMEQSLDLATGYGQRIGELCNIAEEKYAFAVQAALEKLGTLEEETETLRKAKLNAWTASERRVLQDLKLMKASLRQIQMKLMQAIKTRREEPH